MASKFPQLGVVQRGGPQAEEGVEGAGVVDFLGIEGAIEDLEGLEYFILVVCDSFGHRVSYLGDGGGGGTAKLHGEEAIRTFVRENPVLGGNPKLLRPVEVRGTFQYRFELSPFFSILGNTLQKVFGSTDHLPHGVALATL